MKPENNSQTLPETEICLFVGGPLDGDWREINDKSDIAFAAPDDAPHSPETYHRVVLLDEVGAHGVTLYGHRSIDGMGGLLSKLINGYRNPKGD